MRLQLDAIGYALHCTQVFDSELSGVLLVVPINVTLECDPTILHGQFDLFVGNIDALFQSIQCRRCNVGVSLLEQRLYLNVIGNGFNTIGLQCYTFRCELLSIGIDEPG